MVHLYPSDMAQNFWTAIFAFSVNMAVTMLVSVMTRPKPDAELVGLVYSLTPRHSTAHLPVYQRPAVLAGVVVALLVILNLVFA